MKLNYGKALKLSFTGRCIDDLLTPNNILFVNKILNIILYSLELVLNKTSESDVHVSYLDIISINQNIF